MDHVESFKYNIYLSYPEAPGVITLHGNQDKELVINREPTVDESERNNDQLLYPFNAFSARGTVTVSIVCILEKPLSDKKKKRFQLSFNSLLKETMNLSLYWQF